MKERHEEKHKKNHKADGGAMPPAAYKKGGHVTDSPCSVEMGRPQAVRGSNSETARLQTGHPSAARK